MAYGEIKVDSITYTANGSDTTVSVSGLVQNPTFSGDITVTGTISGNIVQGGTLVSGATVSGTAGEFGTITGNTAGFTTVTGTTITGTTVNAVSGVFTTQISGATVTGNTGQFTNITGGAAGFTSVTGTTVTGTTANFTSGVFTTQISGTTITGNAGQFSTLTGGTAGFTTITGTTVTGTTANFVTVSGTTVTGGNGNFTAVTTTTANVTSGVFASGTEGAPSVSVGTTDNGLYSPGADQVAISTNGTGRLFVDASGRLGLGTSSPAEKLHIEGAGAQAIRLRNSTTGSAGSPQSTFIYFYGHQGTGGVEPRASIEAQDKRSTENGGWLNIATANSSNTLVNALHIDNSQRVGIGTTGPSGNLDVRGLSGTSIIRAVGVDSNGNADAEIFSTGTTGTSRLFFADTAAKSGSIIYSHSNNSFAFATNGGGADVVIDSDGRLLVGTSTSRSIPGSYSADSRFQLEGGDNNKSAFSITNTTNGAAARAANIRTARIRGTGAVVQNDTLGLWSFFGHDGTDFIESATIRGMVDGTPGASDMPGRLVFSTTADGASSPTERMKITSDGKVTIAGDLLPDTDNTGNVGTASLTWNDGQFTDLSVNGTLTAHDIDNTGRYVSSITAVSALAIDCASGNYFTKTINANSTFTFTNVPSSRAFSFTLELTHTSGTVTWPSSVEFPGDTAPTLTTGKTHLFMFVTDNGGTRFRGASLVDYDN